jgi:putative DNA primase/helicase
MRVSAYLKANGWERYRRRDEGGHEAPREWRYRR